MQQCYLVTILSKTKHFTFLKYLIAMLHFRIPSLLKPLRRVTFLPRWAKVPEGLISQEEKLLSYVIYNNVIYINIVITTLLYNTTLLLYTTLLY